MTEADKKPMPLRVPFSIVPLGATDEMIEMCAVADDGAYLTSVSFKFPRSGIVSEEFDKCVVSLNKFMADLLTFDPQQRPLWTTCLGKSEKGVKLRKLLPTRAS